MNRLENDNTAIAQMIQPKTRICIPSPITNLSVNSLNPRQSSATPQYGLVPTAVQSDQKWQKKDVARPYTKIVYPLSSTSQTLLIIPILGESTQNQVPNQVFSSDEIYQHY